MTVKEAVETRKSIRKYSSKPVEKEKLAAVLNAGRLAPSARNLQDWKIIAVTEPEKIRRMQKACMNQPQVGSAPVTLVVCAENDSDMPCGMSKGRLDCSIAMSFMILQAWELGLGTCWLGAFDRERVKKVLGIPRDVKVVAVSPMGYPAEDPEKRPRKDAGRVISYDEY